MKREGGRKMDVTGRRERGGVGSNMEERRRSKSRKRKE